MFREIGVLLIALASSGSAMAQTLQCKAFISQDLKGVYGGAIEVVVPRPGPEYQITGAGCEFDVWTGTPGQSDPNARAIIEAEQWINNSAGYACKARGPTANSFVQTTATIFACYVVRDYDPVDPPSSLSPANGDDIVVARRGVAFAKPLAYDYRVCNTGASDLNVLWSDDAHADPNDRSLSKLVHPGACIEFGGAHSPQRATSIRVAAQSSNGGVGQFARYTAGTFADVVRVDAFPTGIAPNPATYPANAKETAVGCTNVPNPAAPQHPNDTIWVRQCMLPIPIWGHYRICFDQKYVELPGGALSDWPDSRLPMVLDKAVIGMPSASNTEDARTNWIFPSSCRDYWDVTSAYVLVGRSLGDANFNPGGQWDPDKVQKIHLWIAQIK
jgi:hypothetical protein